MGDWRDYFLSAGTSEVEHSTEAETNKDKQHEIQQKTRHYPKTNANCLWVFYMAALLSLQLPISNHHQGCQRSHIIIKVNQNTYSLLGGFAETVPLSMVHEIKGLIDLSEGQCVSNKLIHLQLLAHVVIH